MDGFIIILALLGAFVSYLVIKVEKLEEKIEFLEYALKQTHLDFNTDINRVEMALYNHIRQTKE